MCDMCVCVIHLVCVRLSVFRRSSRRPQEMHLSHSALNGEGFLEAADGMKCAAVKLEENLGEDQISPEAKEGASS